MSGDHDRYGGCRTRYETRLVDEVYELQQQINERDQRIAELHKALAMTNCMIKCGDYHSEQSEQIVRKALDGN